MVSAPSGEVARSFALKIALAQDPERVSAIAGVLYAPHRGG